MTKQKIMICLTLLILFIGGCNKTLYPDRLGIGFVQQRFKADNDAFRGFNINLQWDLK